MIVDPSAAVEVTLSPRSKIGMEMMSASAVSAAVMMRIVMEDIVPMPICAGPLAQTSETLVLTVVASLHAIRNGEDVGASEV